MTPSEISNDPGYDLFQRLIDANKAKKAVHPHQMSELDIRRYIDQGWFQQEKEQLFSNVPLIVGFSSMISEPRSHFTFDLAGKPMIIARDKEGVLRCFLNVCRHRGVRLTDSPTVSKSRTFICQYHHWTYDLKGTLVFVPSNEAFPNLDIECRGLVSLPLEEKYGLIWVNPNQDGKIDLDTFLGSISSDLKRFDIDKDFFFNQNVHKINANWKLIIEAFLDGYHVTRLHKNTVGEFFLDNEAIIEREKQHTRSLVARKSFIDAMDLDRDAWDFREHVSASNFIFPNTILIYHPDYVSQLSLFPSSPDQTIVIHNCVVDEEPVSDKAKAHFEKSFKLIDEGVFKSEDFHVCEQAQIGLRSQANKTHLVGGYEEGIRLFQQILAEVMGPLLFDKE